MQSFKMIFSGVTILQGVEFPIFPIDFARALQQCSATALPVINVSIAEGGHILIALQMPRLFTPPTLTSKISHRPGGAVAPFAPY